MAKLNYSQLLLRLVIFLVLSHISFSKSIVKNLPGFLGDLPFKLETGYTGIGEGGDVQLFYYFVESERNPTDDPLVIWIAGGPGCSSLRAFFYEIGPLTFDYTYPLAGRRPKLDLNPYSWTKVANVIYLDTPVGSGFSYGKRNESYKTSDTLSSKHVYTFLMEWLKDHPRFISNPLYISGVSYSGVTIPLITQQIYNGNENGNHPQINIQGYLIGNPLTDRNIDFNSRIPYANHFALLSNELFEATEKSCGGDYINVSPDNGLCATDLNTVDEELKNIFSFQILEPNCGLQVSGTRRPKLSRTKPGRWSPGNRLRLPQLPRCREDTYDYYIVWANDRTVQRALGVRQGTLLGDWEACNRDHYYIGKSDTPTYTYDVSTSLPYHNFLTTKNCRALVFSGDHDMVIPYIGTQRWIKTSLDLSVDSTWQPWFVEDEVAGYTEIYSKDNYTLTYATVKGAGHAAPEYKPEECLAMVDRWFSHRPL